MDTTLKAFVIISILIPYVDGVSSPTGTDLKNLKAALFTGTNPYNKNVRPEKDDYSTATSVTVDFALVGINSFSDTDQKLTTTGYLTLKWVDEELTWTTATYGGLESFLLPQNDVWRPDIALGNGFESYTALGQSFIQVSLDFNGNVEWSPYEVFESACSVDIRHWPFDEQSCDIQFIVWTSTISDVRLSVGTSGFTLSNFEENGMWEIKSMTSSVQETSTESTVTFTLNMKRKPTFYVLYLIVPSVILALLNAFTFILPAASGEKVGYAITVFLAFALFQTIVTESLPANADTVSTIAAYLYCQLVIGAIVIIVTMIELRIFFRDNIRKVPESVFRFTKFILYRKCLCVCCKRKDEQEIEMDEYDGEWTKVIGPWLDCDWAEYVDALDFVLFWFFLIVIIITTFIGIYFPYANIALF